jgi:type IV pilus assembly protein PilC
MPVFLWKGKNRRGQDIQGEVEAETREEVEAKLHSQGVIPSKIKKKPKEIQISFLKQSVKIKDIVIFTRQITTMIEAGLPLVQSLEILSSQTENKTFREILSDIKVSVESGSTLSKAMEKHPKVFNTLFVNMINAAELSGNLDVIFTRLATFMEKSMALQRKIKGALFYPVSIMVVAAIVVSILLIKVVPTFASMFSGAGQALPMPTQIVINISNWLRAYIVYLVIGIFITGVAVKQIYTKTAIGRKMFDKLFLKLPVFGDLIRKAAVAKFTRTLGTMLQSGVSILEAMDITAKTAGNVILEAAVNKARDSIKEGKDIATPLAETKVFPPMVVQMIAIGESTGALDAMLYKIADFYDDEVDQAVSNLTALMEPMIMVVLGGLIGGLIVAMYLPIFKMGETI